MKDKIDIYNNVYQGQDKLSTVTTVSHFMFYYIFMCIKHFVFMFKVIYGLDLQKVADKTPSQKEVGTGPKANGIKLHTLGGTFHPILDGSQKFNYNNKKSMFKTSVL